MAQKIQLPEFSEDHIPILEKIKDVIDKSFYYQYNLSNLEEKYVVDALVSNGWAEIRKNPFPDTGICICITDMQALNRVMEEVKKSILFD